MKTTEQSRLLSYVVSPYGLAMFSYALFLFSSLIPPSVYSYFMKEPDLMFLDSATILFYSLCVVSFIGGVRLVSWLFPSPITDRRINTRIGSLLFLLTPLIFGIVIAITTDYYLIRHFPNILLSLLSQQGGEIKDTLNYENDTDPHLMLVPIVLTGITWWAFQRYSELGFKGWRKRSIQFFLMVSVLSVVTFSALVVSRNVLILIISGLAILYGMRRAAKRTLSVRFIFRAGVAFATCASLLIMLFSLLRGVDNWGDQVRILIGYSIASYNRLAAIVNGGLRYPFAGRGVYLSSYAAYSHGLNRLIPLSRIINPPDFLDLWGSEFGAVSRAGLDGKLIWSGTFGYIFSDLGWFSLPFIFGYGMLYGFIWRLFKRGTVFGVVLYPYFANSILFWLSTNGLLDQLAVLLVGVAIVLAIYEMVFVRQSDAFHVSGNAVPCT
jgi:hypothetical protein